MTVRVTRASRALARRATPSDSNRLDRSQTVRDVSEAVLASGRRLSANVGRVRHPRSGHDRVAVDTTTRSLCARAALLRSRFDRLESETSVHARSDRRVRSRSARDEIAPTRQPPSFVRARRSRPPRTRAFHRGVARGVQRLRERAATRRPPAAKRHACVQRSAVYSALEDDEPIRRKPYMRESRDARVDAARGRVASPGVCVARRDARWCARARARGKKDARPSRATVDTVDPSTLRVALPNASISSILSASVSFSSTAVPSVPFARRVATRVPSLVWFATRVHLRRESVQRVRRLVAHCSFHDDREAATVPPTRRARGPPRTRSPREGHPRPPRAPSRRCADGFDGFRPTVGVLGMDRSDPVRVARAMERAVRWRRRRSRRDRGGWSRGRGGATRESVGGEVQATRGKPRARGGAKTGAARASGTGTGTGVPRAGRPRRIEAARTRFGRSLGPPARLRGFDGAATPPPRACEAPRSRGRVSRGACGRSRRPTRRRGRAEEILHAQGTALLTQGRGSSAEHPMPAHAPRVVVLPVVVRAGRDVGDAMARRVDARRPSGARA